MRCCTDFPACCALSWRLCCVCAVQAELGTPMFPRHLQSVGSRYFAHAGHSRVSCVNRDFPRCPWWTTSYPQYPTSYTQYTTSYPQYPTSYPQTPTYYPQNLHQPVSTWHPQEYFRPYPFPQKPSLLGPRPPFFPWAPGQQSWIHISHYNMNSTGDEPIRKRKNMEGDNSGRKMWPKRSYPPAKDFSIPSAQDLSGLTASPQPEIIESTTTRNWEDFSHLYCEPPGDRGKFDFSVLCYNILSQDLLEDNSYLYDHCRRPHLFWNFRLPNILKEMEEMNADILCLQEVQKDHYQEQIKPSLEALGYICEFKSRTGSKSDGCAICFKSDKFNLMLVKPVEYFRQDITLLDRDNVGLLLMLQPKLEKEAPTICVANTHLLYNPRRGDIKLTQLAILLAEITEVAQIQDGKFCPIILCGDFNSVPGSPLHRFIKEGRLNYEGMTIGKVSGQEQYTSGQRILSIPIWPKTLGITQKCVYEAQKKKGGPEEAAVGYTCRQTEASNYRELSNLNHHFSLSSVYSHVSPNSGMPEVTTCHSRSAVTVDYIFYSAHDNDPFAQPGVRVPYGLQLLGRLSLLTEKDLWSVNGLPNETNSSDHLSLLARFRLEV
ncbi:protein angel homolog 2 isoform X2 [Rana temporaria]|uniref:protein angel homolog 2 isoform X2 n=1 Tax=Rana temporaria TaxID=8407 RepID=UPI001AADFB7D|nr:protein angel homolog 2 isoform X2 [Rana temporaria]